MLDEPLLAIFNLLPGLPLDGGRLLRAAVWAFGARPVTGTQVAAVAGRAVAVGVAASGLAAERDVARRERGDLLLRPGGLPVVGRRASRCGSRS